MVPISNRVQSGKVGMPVWMSLGPLLPGVGSLGLSRLRNVSGGSPFSSLVSPVFSYLGVSRRTRRRLLEGGAVSGAGAVVLELAAAELAAAVALTFGGISRFATAEESIPAMSSSRRGPVLHICVCGVTLVVRLEHVDTFLVCP